MGLLGIFMHDRRTFKSKRKSSCLFIQLSLKACLHSYELVEIKVTNFVSRGRL